MDKINNINFKGSFLINYKNVPVGTRKNLETVIGKNGKVVFDNFANKKESVMYVLRNSKDKAVADFVEQNKLDFKYYPEINTQFRFDSDDESTLVNYIKNNKPKIISNLNDLSKYTNNIDLKVKKSELVPRHVKILQSLKANYAGNVNINNESGITTINNDASGLKSIISPTTKKGGSYVLLKENFHEQTKMLLLNRDLSIEKSYKTPDEILEFRHKFNESVNRFKQIQRDRAKNTEK